MLSVWLPADGSIRLEQQGAPMPDEAECKYVHEYLDVRRGGGYCSENPGRRSSWRKDDKQKRKLGGSMTLVSC